MNIEKVLENFRKNQFEAVYFDTKNEATEYLDEKINNTTVAYGGSMTVSETGLLEKLKMHNEIFSHWSVPEGEDPKEAMLKAASTEVYLTSANAATETGELVNIDGHGNRVSSSLFGHKKVYFIIGINKFEENLEKAIWRARNIASPLNAQRLKRNTPCAVKGDKCYNCSSPERICRGLVVHYKKMTSCDMEVVIVGEKLGF